MPCTPEAIQMTRRTLYRYRNVCAGLRTGKEAGKGSLVITQRSSVIKLLLPVAYKLFMDHSGIHSMLG